MSETVDYADALRNFLSGGLRLSTRKAECYARPITVIEVIEALPEYPGNWSL